MGIRPLRDFIVVKYIEDTRITESGILVVDIEKKESPDRGEVVAIGSGKPLDDGTVQAMETKPGDIILFSRKSSQPAKVDGTEYFVVREEDIMGIVT